MIAHKTDIRRLQALHTVYSREKAAAEAANNRLDALVEQSARLRRETLALERRLDAGRTPAILAQIAAKQAERGEIEGKASDLMAELEVMRERTQAANRLRNRCSEWATTHIGGRI